MRKNKSWVVLALIFVLCLLVCGAHAESGWIKEGTHLVYYKDDVKVTGSQTIDGTLYTFTDEGYLKGNGKVQKTGYRSYYYIDTNNNLKTGWQTIDGYKYYFDPETGMAATWYTEEIDGKTYVFDDSCHLVIDGWYDEFYGDSNGNIVTGYQKIGEEYYYFNENGASQNGFQTVNNTIHYFTSVDYGWRYQEIRGWKEIGTSFYYFDLNTGAMFTGDHMIDGIKYSFTNDGALKVSSGVMKIGEFYYAFDSNNQKLTGWQTISGNKYLFNSDGEAITGAYTDWDKNESYYFANDGVMQTGFIVLDGKTYYYDDSGKKIYGWQIIDGDTYCFSWYYDGGVMYTGPHEFYDDEHEGRYYFAEDGKMQTGWITIDKNTYYYGADGKRVSYWQTIGAKGTFLTYMMEWLSVNDIYLMLRVQVIIISTLQKMEKCRLDG